MLGELTGQIFQNGPSPFFFKEEVEGSLILILNIYEVTQLLREETVSKDSHFYFK